MIYFRVAPSPFGLRRYVRTHIALALDIDLVYMFVARKREAKGKLGATPIEIM
jgi:hypothetical protein